MKNQAKNTNDPNLVSIITGFEKMQSNGLSCFFFNLKVLTKLQFNLSLIQKLLQLKSYSFKMSSSQS